MSGVGPDEPEAATQDAVDVGPLYTPAPDELQLTVRAVLTGCLLGAVVCAMNIYFGLKTGWSIGGSLISAILGFSFFRAFAGATGAQPLTRLEVNIAQTAGSAAGSMTSAAGLLSAIPAMQMLGYELGYFELTLWAASIAWLGVFYAVPLREQMVLVEKLTFPTGTATANTIMSMFAEGADALRKSRFLLGFGIMAAALQLVVHFFPEVGQPPLEAWIPLSALGVLATYQFSLLNSPLMWGAGVLIGPRVATSLVIGAVVAWGVLSPWSYSAGLVPDSEAVMSMKGARGWILWPGVAIMVADALTSLALSWRTILNTFRPRKGEQSALDTSDDPIPTAWWVGGLAVASVLTVGAAWHLFSIHPIMTLLAVAMSSVLATIATRSTGETDINPIGPMGKVTQLVYGGLAPGDIQANLMTAAITSSGASQAGDMMQDLKTGWLLGASPRQQIVAQLAGVTAGIFICVPTYLLFDATFDIGGTGKLDANGNPMRVMPAPAAQAWKGMAEVLSKGLDALPDGAIPAVVAGLVVGAAIPILKKVLKDPRWLPSGLAMGVAFIVPAYYSLAMFFGMVAYQAWMRVDKVNATALGYAVACGLIAGEGLMGIGTAVLQLFELDRAWLVGLFG
ncbi:MAG: OPT/YSL family transporter [Alphaproteobacteria bacterium]|nr:OPT/YSL family transporter [Alphaproteobacteria bacterium]MCB9690749.1 OPT/YSL family transporter [Alphaproteobacteria bacterium]